MIKKTSKNRIFFEILGVLFACFIIGIFVLDLVVPDHEMSVREKRTLSRFPSVSAQNIASGDFSKDFESYASDQIVFRDLFTGLKVRVDGLIGKTESQGVYKGRDGFLIEKMDPIDETSVDITMDSVIRFAETVSCGSTFILVPNAVSVYSDKLPAAAVTEDQHAFFNTEKDTFSAHGIQCPDLFDTLLQNKDSQLLYYRSDHHWTSYAANLCSPLILSVLGKTLNTDYTALTVCDTFIGSMASKSGYSVSVPDTIDIYVPAADTDYIVTKDGGAGKTASIYSEEGLYSNDPYTVFLGGNSGHIRIETANIGAGSLLVFKDSYFNCFLPFLLPYYETIDIVDPRYYSSELSELMAQNMYDQVLFFYNINTFAQDTSLSLVLNEYMNQEDAS